jgi:hypothetical protein
MEGSFVNCLNCSDRLRRKEEETNVSYLSLWKVVARSEGAWLARKDRLEFISSKMRGLVADCHVWHARKWFGRSRCPNQHKPRMLGLTLRQQLALTIRIIAAMPKIEGTLKRYQSLQTFVWTGVCTLPLPWPVLHDEVLPRILP